MPETVGLPAAEIQARRRPKLEGAVYTLAFITRYLVAVSKAQALRSALRRYEILLPSRFNDGRPIAQDLAADTLHELEQAFRAVSCETQAIHGLWRHEGEL